MRPYPVADRHKVEHSDCYGMGCSSCLGRGWFESDEGRESRQDAEDRRADAIRKGEGDD